MVKFACIIYSCKKYSEKSELLYYLVNNKLNDCVCYIAYGDDTIQTEFNIINNKYIVLKCKDYYENLCEKTVALCKTIKTILPNIQGIFKCDDDIIPNISFMNSNIQYIDENNVDYMGRNITNHNDFVSEWHINKCNDIKHNESKNIKSSVYASGPCYYLSNKSITIIAHAENIEEHFYEDCMVGYYLNQKNIFPNGKYLYTDVLDEINTMNYHNSKNKVKLQINYILDIDK